MAITFSTVTCYEEHASSQENWDEDEMTAQVVLRCAWGDRHSLVADLLGSAKAWPYGSLTNPPRCRSCAVVPDVTTYTQDSQGATYLDALVTASYSTRTRSDLISESLEPTAEFMTLDYKRFKWSNASGDPLQEGEAPGRLLRGMNLVRQIQRATSIPASILTLPGCVNSAAYSSSLLGLTFPIGTLLFSPPTMSRTITTAGVTAWNLTLKFSYKPEGWNKFWRAKTQAYESLYLTGVGTYNNYPLASFSDFLS